MELRSIETSLPYPPVIEFREADGNWQPMPPWADFMMRFGHCWPSDEHRPRRIAIISLPSDCAAAGLIALGALIRDMGKPRANDIDGHYDRLVRYAQQYLENCRHCELPDCNPEEKRCGFLKKATGVVRSPHHHRRKHRISDRTDAAQGRLAFDDRTGTYWPNSQYLTDWHIEGEPPAQWAKPEGQLEDNLYRQLVPNALFHLENLRKTYSGLCLAGRTGGGNATREVCASVRIRDGSVEQKLDELLTIKGWSSGNVSRIAFFNNRTAEFDRIVAPPNLVVADGDASFLNVLDHAEFRTGDVIGVIHRIIERDRLEAVGNKLASLRLWYVPDEDMLSELPAVPKGTSISILRRRT